MAKIRYELKGYHPQTKQTRVVGSYDSYQDARFALDAIDAMIRQVMDDSELIIQEENPWELSIIDHQYMERKP